MSERSLAISCLVLNLLLSLGLPNANAQSEPVRFHKQVVTHEYYCDCVAAGDIDGDQSIDLVAGPFRSFLVRRS